MNEKNEMSDQSFLTAILLFFSSIFLVKHKSAILKLYFEHRILVAALLTFSLAILYWLVKKKVTSHLDKKNLEKKITYASEGEDATLAGFKKDGDPVYIKHKFRRMHTQIVGTTNAGKTESVIIPWAVDDIKRGRGLIMIDGKSDRSLMNKLYAYAKRYGREEDVRVLSLCDVGISHSFNPLAGGSPLEVTERVFKALSFENEYFKGLQYEAFLQTLIIFEACNIVATPLKVVEFLRSPVQVKSLALKSEKRSQVDWAMEFTRLTREEREQRTSGLTSQLQVFSVGETAMVFNPEKSDIDLNIALKENHIIYCQLPVLKIPTLGKITGKLVLQSLQSAIASRHLGQTTDKKEFFSVYLDDFTEYLTEGFVSLLNKSRSAHVLIVFAHQALGDLAALGEDIKNSILTNANLKVFMRTNEPTSADYFSKVIGTAESEKLTERQKSGILGATKTGDGSVREVEQYKYHPNLFKQGLGVGEAVVVIPHEKGSLPMQLQFRMLPDLEAPIMPVHIKQEPLNLPLDQSVEGMNKGNRKLQASGVLESIMSQNVDQDIKAVA